MTKSFLLTLCVLSVACGRLEPGDTHAPGVVYVCAATNSSDYFERELAWAVDSWAQTGAQVALSACGENVATLNDAEVPEEWARLIITHHLGRLLGAELTEQGIMRDWELADEARAFQSAFVCPDVSATSQIEGADHPCPLPEARYADDSSPDSEAS
jgi:hypothetical protein